MTTPTPTEIAELLPCRAASLHTVDRGAPVVFQRRSDIYGVYCQTCQCSTEYYATEAEAITAWNTQATLSQPLMAPKKDGTADGRESLVEPQSEKDDRSPERRSQGEAGSIPAGATTLSQPSPDYEGLIEQLRRYADPGDLSVGPNMIRCALIEAANALTALSVGEQEEPAFPWPELLALVKAATAAANWIEEARRIAKHEGSLSLLPVGDCSPGKRGVAEQSALRKAVTKLGRAALPPAPDGGAK